MKPLNYFEQIIRMPNKADKFDLRLRMVKYANKLQQFCLAHLIRDIKFLTTLPNEVDKRFGKALLTNFKWLFHIWHLRDKIPKNRFDRIMSKIKNRILNVDIIRSNQDLPSKSAAISKRFVKHGDAMCLLRRSSFGCEG